MRKKAMWFAMLWLSVAGTCQRSAVVTSGTTRPDRSGVGEAEAAIRVDLEELIRAQEAFWSENERYALDIERLVFTPSPGVLIDILEAERDGFSAIGTDEPGGAECAVFVGSVDPPRSYVDTAGIVVCRR